MRVLACLLAIALSASSVTAQADGPSGAPPTDSVSEWNGASYDPLLAAMVAEARRNRAFFARVAEVVELPSCSPATLEVSSRCCSPAGWPGNFPGIQEELIEL